MTEYTSSLDLYISVDDPEYSCRESKEAFIYGGNLIGAPFITDSQPSFILGGGMLSAKHCYIPTGAGTVGGRDCFIEGHPELQGRDALRFEAAQQQYVQINDIVNYDNLDRFTLNLWVRPRTDWTTSKQGIFIKEGVIETWVNNSPGNYIAMRVNVAGVWYQVMTPYDKYRWHMLTIKHDGTTLRFYKNGLEFASPAAPGMLTSNDNPIYFGRYPSLSTYSDIDMCDVQLWNDTLSAVEIGNLYRPPARRSCQHAYIHVGEEVGIDSLKRAYINSASSSTNPFTIRSSMRISIPDNYVLSQQSAYVVAGGETTTTFDNRIVRDFTSHITFDNIIMVRDSRERLNQIQLGSVVYPITRYAYRIVRIPTRLDPLVDVVHQDCWITTHTGISASRPAYIHVNSGVRSNRQVFLNGHRTIITDNQLCFIRNTQMEDTQPAFIAGLAVLPAEVDHLCYVNGYSDNISDGTPAFIQGGETSTTSLGSYVSGPNMAMTSRQAFIMSQAFTQASSRSVFLRGGGVARETQHCYMYGVFTGTDGQPAYITAIPTITTGKPCYINSASLFIALKPSHVRGHIGVTLSQPLYLKAEVHVVDNNPCYIAGVVSDRYATWAHINGPVTTPTSSLKRCYISNNVPLTSKFAFIVSGPQSSKACYIVSAGNGSRSKGAYIAGT